MMERAVLLRRTVAVLLWLVGLASVAYGSLNAVEGPWTIVQLGLSGVAFGAVGLLLATRTGVGMGWLFLAAQGLMGLSLAFPELVFGLLVLMSAVLLLFPTGRLPSRRWMFAAFLLAGASIVWLLTDILGVLDDEDLSWLVYFVSSTSVLTASAIRLVNDYRKAVGQTRQQLKWLAWVLLVGGVLLIFSTLGISSLAQANQVAGVVLLVGGPIAIGLAVTRYRLYEIDRIISRTVSYAIVVAILAAAVAGVAAAVSTQFDNPLLVAATTLGIAAVFNPLRKRVQNWVDRRFNRSKYDHERVVEQFTRTLRGGVDMDGLVNGWISVVDETMQPRHIGVWTRTS